ncbi:MAG: S-layer homology domain-containing protein [Lachnospiraceae bacterium]|nr:S-layer homology domain-containing protein [Lachnospiraceae bacterium]
MNKFAKYICAIMVMSFVIAVYSISAFAERSGDPDPDADESYSGTWIFTQKESYFSKGELFDVIEGEHGELIIIDGGSARRDTHDPDSEIIEAAIERMQSIIAMHDDHVNAWIMTHMHLDHCGVFSYMYENGLLDNVTVDHVYLSDRPSTEEMLERYSDHIPDEYLDLFISNWDRFNSTMDQLEAKAEKVHYISEGDNFDLFGISCKVLSAYDQGTMDQGILDAREYDQVGSLENDTSTIIHMTFPSGDTLLITGDAEYRVFDRIRAGDPDCLKADYIQVSHHGSNYDTSIVRGQTAQEWAELFDAKAFFIPHRCNSAQPKYLKTYLENAGFPVYTSAADKSIELTIIPQIPVITDLKLTDEGAELTWTESERASSYMIYRSINGDEFGFLSESELTAYTDAAIEKGNTYEYKICASGLAVSEFSAGRQIRVSYPFYDVSEDEGYYEPVLWAYENGIVKGTGKNYYSPQAACTRANFAIMLWRLYGSPEPESTSVPFADLGNDMKDTRTKAVLWAYENGIINGYSDGTFKPNKKCTRAQIVIMLWKAAGKPEPKGRMPFTDSAEEKVGKNQAKAILWTYRAGITKGTTSKTFSPNKACKRYQIAYFLCKYNNFIP